MGGTVTLTSNTRGLAWGIGLLALAALLIPSPAWMMLLICLGGVWGVAYGWMRVLRERVSAERMLQSNWIAIDDVLVEQFRIHNRSWLPVAYIEISDQSTVPGYRPAFVTSVNRHTSRDWRQAAVCTHRGRYQLGPWSLRLGDPFGFYTLTITYDAINEIVIHPPVLPHLPIPLPIGRRDGQWAHPRRGQQADLNVAGVRHYRPNDPRRHIHWPTTARRNTLYVREFEHESGGEVWVLLDMAAANQFGSGRERSEEQAVLVAATVIERLVQRQQAVGLAAYSLDPRLLTPVYGAQQRWRLLEALATVTANGPVSLGVALRDLRRQVQSGAALLVVTATDSAEWVADLLEFQPMGVSVSVGLLDRASHNASGDSSALQRRLTLANVPCTLIRRHDMLRTAPQRQTGWQQMETQQA